MKALDKKLRRKTSRKARALGLELHLTSAQGHAQRKFNKINTLNNIIDNEPLNDKLAAAKAKRAMNEVWIKSGREYYDARVTPTEVKDAVLRALQKDA